jgi:predicted transglutaminase-like protease
MLVHIILVLYFSSEFIWMNLQFYCKVHFKLLHTSVMIRQIVWVPNAVSTVVRFLKAPCEPYSFICVSQVHI